MITKWLPVIFADTRKV